MADALYGHAVTSDGSFVYSASGANVVPSGGNVNLFRRYNPTTNVWEVLPDVPTAVAGATLAYDAAGGRLFLFGGADISTTILTLVQVFTFSTNSWTPGPPLPAPRTAMGGGVVGGRVYLVGGSALASGGSADQNWEFDPGAGTYAVKALLPSPLAAPGSGISGGRLYIMGGRDAANNALNSNYEYDPATDSWATKAPLDIAVNAPGGTALGAMTAECHGDIIIIGGGTPFLDGEGVPAGAARAPESTPLTQIYDIATNTWGAGPTLPTARFSLRAGQAGNTLIAFGGYDGIGTVATVDRIQGPPLPVQLQGFQVE
jgi:N-acetylneuraminic acid mutarotase